MEPARFRVSPRRPHRTARAAVPHYAWERYDEASLTKLRFRDLGLKIAGSPVQCDIQQLYRELERRGLRFKPHVWFSTEWFSPDGVPGIAIPFFLGHPRLRRLETRFSGRAEGGARPCRLQLLRHETGHALDTAYGLRRRADWREVFGPASLPYPRTYCVRPRSRRYVLHLEHWYAQSHPTEDFAETFAVWLQPKARWRREYAGWPALEKLEYVEELMREVATRRPRNRDRSLVAPLTSNTRTLREHYRRQAGWHGLGEQRFDAWLAAVFAPPAHGRGDVAAARWLREWAPELRRKLCEHGGPHPYVVDEVIRALRQRAASLGLCLRHSKRRSKSEVIALHCRVIESLLRRNHEEYWV
jgi:hypothetical protein